MKVIVNKFSIGLFILIIILYSNTLSLFLITAPPLGRGGGILEPDLIFNSVVPILHTQKEQEVICQRR